MENRYEKFSYLITDINRSLQRIKNLEMKELGLKGKQVQVMYYLYRHSEGCSLSQLSKLCGEDKGAISRTVKELYSLKYLSTEGDNGKYKNPIKLTILGREIGEIIADKIEILLNKGSMGIKKEDREDFYSNLEIISKNLQEICNKKGEDND